MNSASSQSRLLTGQSERIQRVLRIAQDVARSDVTVLIEGESGTGKELVARTIHRHSPRAGRSFISVNCAALSEPLLEGELFGHVKGAFAGANTTKPGRFQLADGGTLFLDEIAELPAKGQGALLRVLEDGAFRMVGGTELVRVNVRILAATRKRLEAAVAAGKFREDLFCRLHLVPILVPPLRERAEDIPMLVDAFLAEFALKHQRPRARFDADALQHCTRFPWPGNVRQLKDTVERAVVTRPGAVIGVEDLPEFLRNAEVIAPACEVRPGMTIADCEKLLIRQTLLHATSNREQAARMLGISRRALQYKLKAYGLLTPRRIGAEPKITGTAVETTR